MDQSYDYQAEEASNEEIAEEYYVNEASWGGEASIAGEAIVKGKKYGNMKTVGIVFAVVIIGLIIGGFIALGQVSNELSTANVSLIKVFLGLAALAVAIQCIYITFVAISSLQQNDSDLKRKNETLQASNDKLIATQSELGESNEYLQEALTVVQDMSEQNEAKATKLQSLAENLDQSQKESDAIFDSVQYGLCLIDSRFNIGKRVSGATFSIFETETLAGQNFVDLMRPLITEKDLKTLIDYLDLQFKGKASKKQLSKHNPLTKVEATLNWDGENFKNKHLGFQFERVKSGSNVSALLVTITDISSTIRLENQIKRSEEAQERKAKLIVEILQNDANEVDLFVAKTKRTLDEINDVLKDNGYNTESEEHESYEEVLEKVFGMVHNIKGNASLLKLQSIASIAHSVEDSLSNLRERTKVKGEEFLSSMIGLAEMRELLTDCEDIILTILRDYTATKGNSKTSMTRSTLFAEEINKFSNEVASDLGKKVMTSCQVEIDNMEQSGWEIVKDIIIQLVRNSIVHGIEKPNDRVARGKLEEGLLSIVCKRRLTDHPSLGGHFYEILVKDDGKGLDLAAIKQKALDNKILTNVEFETINNSKAAGLIFEPNLSTAAEVNEHGGRGAGMHLTKDKVVTELDGKISMRFAKGAYMELTCAVPLNAVEKEKV